MELRTLSGEDEAAVADARAGAFPVRVVSALLARLLLRVGPLSPVPAEFCRELTVGDREALLLHVLRGIVGERIRCVFTCPGPSCRGQLEVEPSVGDLLVPPVADSAPRHEAEIAQKDRVYGVTFRLPTGADQEAAAPLAMRDLDAAAWLILRRCIVDARLDATPVEFDELPASVMEEIEDRMRKLDPQAEIALEVVCPDCGTRSEAAFDAAALLLSELGGRARELYREVHALALHYHWSEAEILAMHPARRRLYLELLDEALSEVARR